MTPTTPIHSLVGALAGASVYAPAELPAQRAEPIEMQAVAEIHRARVEIYCGHNDSAVAGILAAARHLQASAGVPEAACVALDRAAWLIRHDDYSRAEAALDAALARIDFARLPPRST